MYRYMDYEEYHCTDIWIMAAELPSLLWNADISRSVCPSFRRRVSAQRLPIYRMYPVCPILRRRYLAPLSLSRNQKRVKHYVAAERGNAALLTSNLK